MHNIRLDSGVQTKPDAVSMEQHPVFLATRKILQTVFPGKNSTLRIADLGCLEGGFSVEFARMGFQALGLEVRESNVKACKYVQANVALPNLQFVKDDAWNIGKYGSFDVMFCNGLLYHLDKPKRFLELLSSVTSRCLILNTHFSMAREPAEFLSRKMRRRLGVPMSGAEKFRLSRPTENERLPGRWYRELESDQQFANREAHRWASWDNRRSFWIQREYLIGTIRDVGFDLVFEQFDILGPDIAFSMTKGYYRSDWRGMFIALKTGGS